MNRTRRSKARKIPIPSWAWSSCSYHAADDEASLWYSARNYSVTTTAATRPQPQISLPSSRPGLARAASWHCAQQCITLSGVRLSVGLTTRAVARFAPGFCSTLWARKIPPQVLPRPWSLSASATRAPSTFRRHTPAPAATVVLLTLSCPPVPMPAMFGVTVIRRRMLTGTATPNTACALHCACT